MSSADDFDLSALAEIPDPVRASTGARAVATAPKEPAPTREAVRARRAVVWGLSVLWAAGLLVLLGVRPTLLPSVALFHVAIPSALGVVALAFALSRGRLGLGPSLRATLLFALVPPALFLVIGLVFQAPVHPEDHSDALKCGAAEGLAGVVSLALAAIGLARSTVTLSRARGALLGSAIGLVWAGFWGVHCSDASRAHVVLVHGLPVVLFAVAGALLVSRVSRVT